MEKTMHTERTILRYFTESDYSFFCALETNASSFKYEADSIPTQESLNKKFCDMLASVKNSSKVRHIFLVERKTDHIPLGKVLIWQIDKAIDEWEIGWVLAPEHTGVGYATEAVKALIDFGFTQLGANRVCANCNDANLASERVMQRLGMQKEGVFRETRRLNGKWYGSCVYSILSSEFPQKHPATNFCPFPGLETENLRLRRMSHNDLDDLFAMRSDPRMHAHTDTKADESANETITYIDKMNKGVDDNEWIIWAIEHKQSTKVIGTICIWNIDRRQKSGELGYGIIPDYQGRGFMKEALLKVIKYGFDDIGLRIIEAYTEEGNLRSIKLLEGCNFCAVKRVEEEGRFSTRIYRMVVYRLKN